MMFFYFLTKMFLLNTQTTVITPTKKVNPNLKKYVVFIYLSILFILIISYLFFLENLNKKNKKNAWQSYLNALNTQINPNLQKTFISNVPNDFSSCAFLTKEDGFTSIQDCINLINQVNYYFAEYKPNKENNNIINEMFNKILEANKLIDGIYREIDEKKAFSEKKAIKETVEKITENLKIEIKKMFSDIFRAFEHKCFKVCEANYNLLINFVEEKNKMISAFVENITKLHPTNFVKTPGFQEKLKQSNRTILILHLNDVVKQIEQSVFNFLIANPRYHEDENIL